MSIILKPKKIKFKDPVSGNYVGINAISDQSASPIIQDWLDNHPEATTTVQDGSLTLPKFKAGELPFVTPELFGAKGDGETDDTQAWQDAVDSGFHVIATKNEYKCGQIEVSKNISIDCNNADFICTSTTLFNCSGVVVDSFSDVDYSPDVKNYVISDSEYSGYTGFAFLRGTNNFMPTRTYYMGGFVCDFQNGRLVEQYPINVTNVTINIINPITVELKNIGNITHSGNGTNFSIVINYGLNCKIHNINGNNFSSYMVLQFLNCMNCKAYDLNIINDLPSSNNTSYIVEFGNSSFCEVSDSHLINRLWHCVTTGNEYLCFKNRVANSILHTYSQSAYVDHDNALGTIITNCSIAGIYICGLCYVRNVDILTTGSIPALITVSACPLQNCAVYDIANINYVIDSTQSYSGLNGLNFRAEPEQVTGITKYIDKAFIKNIASSKNTKITAYINCASSESLVLNNIYFDGFEGQIFMGKLNTETNVNISNYNLSIVNTHDNDSLGSSTTMTYNNVVIRDSDFYNMRGIFESLHLSNVSIVAQVDTITVNDNLSGDYIKGYIRNSALLIPTRLSIFAMSINDTYTFFNIVNATDGTRWYQYYGANGEIVKTKVQ